MRQDRGTAVIELALALILILMLAIGTYEFGSAFGDRTAMANSVREGARVGSSAGQDTNADCRIIEASAGALAGIASNNVEWLWIYKSDSSGTFPVNERQAYRPAQSSDTVNLVCSDQWFLFQNGWPAGLGRQNGGANRDWLGVRIQVEHDWKTGFLWWNGSTLWEESAIMRLEPAIS